MHVEEPGIDRHVWVTEWEDLQPLVEDSPGEALPEVDALVARMMEARGLPLGERDGEELAERETTREFAEARRITRLVDAGEEVDPGDVAHAVNAYSALYRELLDSGPEAGSPA